MTDLKQIGRSSSAATTDFVSARVDVPGGHLFVDGNQKVSGWNPRPNAFSLLAGNGAAGDEEGHEREHCPGSTPTCRSACYVHGLAKHAGSTYDLYRHNSKMIRWVLTETPFEIADDWAARLGAWIAANCRETGFRWHVSGDVFSHAYASWIADVCRAAPDVRFWIYTRSFEYARPLAAVATIAGGNLALNLSCDADNYEAARAFANDNRGWWDARARLCYLTVDGSVPDDLDPKNDVVFPDYGLRAPKGSGPVEQRETNPWYQGLGDLRRAVCPSDFYGKAERVRCGEGACTRCIA